MANPTPLHDLVVVHAFGAHQRGDRITDDAEIQAVLAGENARSVHRVLREQASETEQPAE